MATLYKVDDRVLAYHGPMVYEAKVLDVKKEKTPTSTTPVTQYFVHYQKWSKNWDEWVTDARLLAPTPDNLQFKKDLEMAVKQKKKQAELEKKAKRAAQKALKEELAMAAEGSSVAGGVVKKRKMEENIDDDLDYAVNLPEPLRQILAEDWYLITKKKYWPDMPRGTTVQQIMAQYRESTAVGRRKKLYHSFAEGIAELFDSVNGAQLLYPQERSLYLSQDQTKRASDLYGGEHLLRLLIKLPEFLDDAGFADDSEMKHTTQFEAIMKEFQEFLLHNKDEFFDLSTYHAKKQ